MIAYSRADSFIHAALNARAVRQDLIASNIANADTPFYRSRDIHFEGVLADRAEKVFGSKSPRLALASSSSFHLQPRASPASQPTLFYRDGQMARNDGNTVDIDIESSELAKNALMYDALIAAYQKKRAIFHAVIDAGKNL